MAFEDFQIRTTPATSDDVLAVLLEHHRQCCIHDPPMDRPLLSRDSTIAEYELSCDVDETPLTHKQLNQMFGTRLSQSEVLAMRKPIRTKTLGELCDTIAPRARLPRIEPVTVVGATSASAGAFLVIRRLFADAGAKADEIMPSAPIEPYLRDHPQVFSKLGHLAPGRMPRPRVVSPVHIGLGWVFLLGQAMQLGGWILRHPMMRLAGVFNTAVSIVAGFLIGRHVKPARIQLGWLRTFRDLSRAMTGEAWGAWHGFPMDHG
jgi:hypothetical protein